MSIKVMAAVWDSEIEDRGELLVLLALADFANDKGECWPSIGTIARKARFSSERGVQKVLRRLEGVGFVKITPGGGRKNCNLYTLNPEPNSVNAVRGGELGDTKPRTGVHKTPNGGSPEPSRTINKPEDFFSDLIKGAAPWAVSIISAEKARQLIQGGFVTEEECKKAGVL